MPSYPDDNFIHEFDAGKLQAENMRHFCIESSGAVVWNDVRPIFKMEADGVTNIWLRNQPDRILQKAVNALLQQKFVKMPLIH